MLQGVWEKTTTVVAVLIVIHIILKKKLIAATCFVLHLCALLNSTR
jgi:hypothetical protein